MNIVRAQTETGMDRVGGEHSLEEVCLQLEFEGRQLAQVIQQDTWRGQRSRGRRGPPVSLSHDILPAAWRGE